MIWPCGSIVRYGKELYKAEAEMNSSEPGNSSQSRFYVRSEAKAKSYLKQKKTSWEKEIKGLVYLKSQSS